MAESRELLASIFAFLLSTTITPPTCFRIPDVDGGVQGTASKHLVYLLSTTITPPTCFRIPDVDGRVQGTASQHLGFSTQPYNHPTHLFPYSRCGWQSPGNC
jgi:hypothetical protein